jgi:hypothetical protein
MGIPWTLVWQGVGIIAARFAAGIWSIGSDFAMVARRVVVQPRPTPFACDTGIGARVVAVATGAVYGVRLALRPWNSLSIWRSA